ncbi:helix-turn-helix domain-containing protein [Branchiibius sp. NY16-3462-2]|uniref:helix-turn-helix domain-containing protein n=1 Tax=Branchiibius sp. NY16-3462-2 TaxID=1807500 RepID=UPI0025BCA8CD|nr:helix-turn-helix domain-containing protein [Branchiibius sp. NY16-3462-2]
MALSDAEVVRLRELYAAGARQVDLATEFGIAQTAVSAIVNGRTRASAGGPIATRSLRSASAPATSPRPAAAPRKTLSAEQIEQVRRRVASGEKRTEIAADLGISRSTIDSIISGRRGTATRKPLSDDQIRQIRSAAASGTPQSLLAQEYGTSQQVISQIVRRVTYRDVP